MQKGKEYIVIDELPEEQQAPLRKWLIGQTVPVILQEGENAHDCCYLWDYNKWLTYWKAGRSAPVTD